jgi:hypothetical protein
VPFQGSHFAQAIEAKVWGLTQQGLRTEHFPISGLEVGLPHTIDIVAPYVSQTGSPPVRPVGSSLSMDEQKKQPSERGLVRARPA